VGEEKKGKKKKKKRDQKKKAKEEKRGKKSGGHGFIPKSGAATPKGGPKQQKALSAWSVTGVTLETKDRWQAILIRRAREK